MNAATGLGVAVVAAGLLLPAPDALALWDDRLELFVAETVGRDDNIFRLSSGRDAAAVLGTPSRADTFYTTSVGFNLDVPVSRQRFLGGVTWNDTRYERYSVLNLKGHSARALWLWRLGNDLSGQLGYTETLALASLANVQGGVQSSTPNFLTARRAFFNGAYMFTPRWRLRGELSRLDHSNDAAERRVNDIDLDGADFTLSYVSPVNNQIGLGLKLDQGRLPERQLLGGNPVDNSYRQHTVAAVADWTMTARSHLGARAGWVSRRFEQVPQRDYDGPTFRVGYDWQATARLAINASIYREISAVEEISVGFVLVKAIALRPRFRLSEKIDLSGVLEYGTREYLGDAERALGIVPARTDRVRLAALAGSYRPTRSVTLVLAVRRETRSSNAAFGDYVSNGISASAKLAF